MALPAVVAAATASSVWGGTTLERRLVVQTGDVAPSTQGAVFAQFGELDSFNAPPTIDELGRVSFQAVIEGGSVDPGFPTFFFGGDALGIWKETSDGLSLVARQGDQAAMVDGPLVYDGFPEALAPRSTAGGNGNVVFWARLLDPALAPDFANTHGFGLWTDRGGEAELITQQFQPAAPLPDGFTWGRPKSFNIDRDNRLLFSAQFEFPQGQGESFSARDREALVREVAGGAMEVVARGGGPAPGMPDGTVFGELDFTAGDGAYVFEQMGADAAQVAFIGNTRDGGVTRMNDQGIWVDKGDGTGLQLIVREGDPIPTIPNAFFRGGNGAFPFGELFGLELTDNGSVFFDSRVRSTDFSFQQRVIFTDRSGQFEPVLRATQISADWQPGDQAPGLPETFSFANIAGGDVNANDHFVAFAVAIEGISDDQLDDARIGLWWDAPGRLDMVAARGALNPPQLADQDGVFVAEVGQLFRPVLTDSDHVYFDALLAGDGITEQNDRAVVVASADGVYQTVFQEGQPIEVSGAGTAVLGNYFLGVPGDGESHDGEVVWDILLQDGTDAVVTTRIGEATTCPTDIDGDGATGVNDLFALLAAWGDCPGCVEDVTGDDVVDVLDLFDLLAAWGACP